MIRRIRSTSILHPKPNLVGIYSKHFQFYRDLFKSFCFSNISNIMRSHGNSQQDTPFTFKYLLNIILSAYIIFSLTHSKYKLKSAFFILTFLIKCLQFYSKITLQAKLNTSIFCNSLNLIYVTLANQISKTDLVRLDDPNFSHSTASQKNYTSKTFSDNFQKQSPRIYKGAHRFGTIPS